MILKDNSTDHTKTIIGMGFLTLFALMLLITWLSMSTLQSVNTDMSQLIGDMGEKTSRAHHMRDVIRLRSGAVRTLVQTNDSVERNRIFKKLVEYTRVYNETREELTRLGANDREQSILTRITQADARVNAAYEEASDVLNLLDIDTATLRVVLDDVQLQELVLLNHLNELVKLEKLLADEALTANTNRYIETRELLLLILLAGFSASLIISGIIATRVARANQRIAHLANHDDLTGLHNRRSFEQHLQQTMAIAERSDNVFGLLYLDMDRFKMVNDTCGHHAGDQLLIQLTQMISERLRRGDLFARVGGDEFAIIAQGQSFSDIRQLAEQLRIIVANFVFQYEDHGFNVSVSIGVTPIDGQVTHLEQILADVDSACYLAKESGRNHVHFTEDNDNEVIQYRNNLAGIQSIHKALAEDRLALFYQPVFDIQPNGLQLAQCEILLRIRSETGELYSPSRFIPIAEKYNVMTQIDRWVFNHVIEWLTDHQSHYMIPTLLINLSGLSFADDEFSDEIIERLSRKDINPEHVAFEISEGSAVRNIQKASLFIERVRALGCRVALDDFGSGFSNFACLKQLSLDYLKIDGSLVRNIAHNDIDRQMVAAINQVGQTLGAQTIAEFVEDDEVLEQLRAMKVNFAQGYGLRMPAALETLRKELPAVDSQKPEEPHAYQIPVGSPYTAKDPSEDLNVEDDSIAHDEERDDKNQGGYKKAS